MISITTLVLIIWVISTAIRASSERKRRDQIARMKMEMANAKIRAKQIADLEKEQARQARELEKHEAMLRKHEEQIAKLEHQMAQAEADIISERERISGLYALLDIAESNQASAVPGSKQDEAAQRKIITLTAQIASAEKRIRKAEFTKATAEKKLAA